MPLVGDADFAAVQEKLSAALAHNLPGVGLPHVIVALPSFNVSETLLAHYADRLPSLEHRYMVAVLVLRIEGCRMVFLTCRHPGTEIMDLYLSLLPPDMWEGAADRHRIIVVDDLSPRPIAAKVLERPEVLAEIREFIGDEPALIEPWSVGGYERDLAVALDVPVNGTPPELWPLAFKSAGRRLMRKAGVAVPAGVEDLHTVAEGVDAIARLRAERPGLAAVVVKHDDSGAGDGNAVIALDGLERPGSQLARRRLRARLNGLPAWYVRDLAKGYVVEERITGTRFSSPSAQIDISPDGAVRVLSTHEQVLGGPDDQVYLGCRFPADPAYAARLGEAARRIGEELAAVGAVGRAAVDFVVGGDDAGNRDAYAIEINLRKGGTTHPFAVLRNLIPGSYDPVTGQYSAPGGPARCYASTDNLVSEAWTSLAPAAVIGAIADSGLLYDRQSQTGVVPHMLSGLAIDGRFGLTAIGADPGQAEELMERCRQVVDTLAVGGDQL